MAPRFDAPRCNPPRFAAPRYATMCAVAALAVGLAGCAATPQPARTAERTVAATKAPEVNTGDALARLAHQTLEKGDPVSAVSMFKRAHEMSPDSAPILAELGRTLAALKAWRESSDAYAKAVDLAPKDPGYRRGHAGALLALDLPTLAEQEYRAALALHEDAPTLCGLGVTLDLQNRHEEALAAFRRALDIDPNGTATRTNLGLSLALWGASNEAIGLLAPMAASSTSDARQRQNLALAFGLSGDIDQARAVARMDLGDEAVRNNLAYYETLRGLAPTLRMRSLMGQPPTLASTGAAAVVSENTGDAIPRPVDATPPNVAPEKPSRAAENAPEPKAKAKPVATATPSKVDSRISTSAVAETAPTKAPRVKAANAAPAKPVEPKAEIASKAAEPSTAIDSPSAHSDDQSTVAIGASVEASTARNDIASVSVAPDAAATTEPVATTESSKHAYDDLAADVRAAATSESQNSAAATSAEKKPAAHNASVDEPVAPEPANDNAPTARANEPESAAKPAASEAAVPAEPKVEASEVPAASSAAANDGAVTDASSGNATASALASEHEARAPTDALPHVSVRVGGVPLASVPQTQVTAPAPVADKTTGAVAPIVETKSVADEAKADVPVTNETKATDVPVADGEPADLPAPPTAEPIKRDGPTRLLPQSHAAIDPLY